VLTLGDIGRSSGQIIIIAIVAIFAIIRRLRHVIGCAHTLLLRTPTAPLPLRAASVDSVDSLRISRDGCLRCIPDTNGLDGIRVVAELDVDDCNRLHLDIGSWRSIA